ncbi:MAG: hypothetical protein ACM3S4_00695 [Burkholderiales bacterium]
MKKYISVFITAALLLSMLAGFGGTALAQGAEISLSASSATVNAGDTVKVTVKITNTFGEDFIDSRVKVAGATDFGGGTSLAVGGSREIPVSFTVSESMLNTDVSFVAEFQTASQPGVWQQGGTASFHITKALIAKINATVSADLTLAKPGDVVTFTINVENQGEAVLENIEVKASQLNNGKALNQPFSLAPGQKQAVTYKHTVTTAATIAPTVSYTVAGSGAPQTFTIAQPVVLELEERKAHTSLTADNPSPKPGEEVTLTLRIWNDGNVPYTELTVTYNGQKMDFPSTTLKKGDDFSQTYKMTFDKSTKVEFTITMKDQKNALKKLTPSCNIQLPVDPDVLSQNVVLNLEPDRTELTSAGTVNFSGRVSNNSDFKITEVIVTEPTLGEVFSVSEMEPGAYQNIEKTVDVNATATYNFTLTFKDRNGQPYTVNMAPVTITILTIEPSPTDPSEEAATVTLEPTDSKSDPLLIWFILAGVLLVLIIGVGVAIFILWKKGKTPSNVSAARSAVPRASGVKPRTSSFNSGVRKGPVKSKSKGFRDRNNF